VDYSTLAQTIHGSVSTEQAGGSVVNHYIPIRLLQKLPVGGTPLSIETIENMDRDLVPAIKWTWYEPIVGWRTAWFTLKDAEYIGEAGVAS
jgi:hypothetical protein